MYRTLFRKAITHVTLALGLAGSAAAQAHVTRADVNGAWEGVLALEGGAHNLSLVFALSDSAFVGSVNDGGQPFGAMERGVLSGDTVKFYVDKLYFTGVIAGSRMTIALVMYNGTTRHFTATKRPAEGRGG